MKIIQLRICANHHTKAT